MPRTNRTDFVAGLHALADFLTANPTLPIPEHGADILIHVRGTDDDQRAEVDRLAGLLDAPVNDETADSGHYTTTRSFGPVDYYCVAIPQAVRAAFNAAMSYANSVTPDTESGHYQCCQCGGGGLDSHGETCGHCNGLGFC
jgi:hypothetical protein